MYFEMMQTGFFGHFPQSRLFQRLPRLNMTFREIPFRETRIP